MEFQAEFNDHDWVHTQTPPPEWRMWDSWAHRPVWYFGPNESPYTVSSEMQALLDKFRVDSFTTHPRVEDYNPSSDRTITDVFIETLKATIVDLWQDKFDQAGRLRTLEQRYNDMVRVAIESISTNSGCMSGKREAAEAKGLVWRPVTTYTLSGSIDVEEGEHGNLESLIDAIFEVGGLNQAVVDRFLGRGTVNVENYDAINWEEE